MQVRRPKIDVFIALVANQREYFLELSQTDDHREAMRAFREKRPPEFRNR